MKWNTQYQLHNAFGEKITQPSEAIPNEALSVREILIRYSRGLPIDEKVPLYDEENDLQSLDPRKMDLADIQEAKERYAEELKTIRENHAKMLADKKAAEEQKHKEEQEYRKQFEEFRQQQQQKNIS